MERLIPHPEPENTGTKNNLNNSKQGHELVTIAAPIIQSLHTELYPTCTTSEPPQEISPDTFAMSYYVQIAQQVIPYKFQVLASAAIVKQNPQLIPTNMQPVGFLDWLSGGKQNNPFSNSAQNVEGSNENLSSKPQYADEWEGWDAATFFSHADELSTDNVRHVWTNHVRVNTTGTIFSDPDQPWEQEYIKYMQKREQ